MSYTDTDIENLKAAALRHLDEADECYQRRDAIGQRLAVMWAGVCISRMYELKRARSL